LGKWTYDVVRKLLQPRYSGLLYFGNNLAKSDNLVIQHKIQYHVLRSDICRRHICCIGSLIIFVEDWLELNMRRKQGLSSQD
jgi:hypothetical protein